MGRSQWGYLEHDSASLSTSLLDHYRPFVGPLLFDTAHSVASQGANGGLDSSSRKVLPTSFRSN